MFIFNRAGLLYVSDAFLYYTDGAIATLEGALDKKSVSRIDKERFFNIALDMLIVVEQNLQVWGNTPDRAVRLAKRWNSLPTYFPEITNNPQWRFSHIVTN